MWLIDEIAERRIAEAIARGELDNLPGAGKPLALEDDGLVPKELRLAYRVLKNAGYLPPELELRREIQQAEALLQRLEEPGARGRALQRLGLLQARLGQYRGQRVDLAAEARYRERLLEVLARRGDGGEAGD